MTNILLWLSGKKTTIVAIIMLLVTFASNQGYISQAVAELIASIMVALGLYSNYQTKRIYERLYDEDEE